MRLLLFFLISSFTFLVAGSMSVSFAGGKVFVLNKISGYKIRLKTGDQVNKNDVILTGRRSFVVLRCKDGSVYKVFPKSTLNVEKYVDNSQRRLKIFILKRGKMFIFIRKTFRKSNVKILTQTRVMPVRGTSFLLENTADKFKVSLIEGKLSMFSSLASSDPLVYLKAGQVISQTAGKDKIKELNREDLEVINREISVDVTQFKPWEEYDKNTSEREGGEETNLNQEGDTQKLSKRLKDEAIIIIKEVEENYKKELF